MPWRIEDGVDVLEYEIDPPQMTVDVAHNKDRRVFVRYVNDDGEQVDVAVEHLTDVEIDITDSSFVTVNSLYSGDYRIVVIG